ncbi:MAG: tetratricopeptide repeat protein [Methanothrix sp.]
MRLFALFIAAILLVGLAPAQQQMKVSGKIGNQSLDITPETNRDINNATRNTNLADYCVTNRAQYLNYSTIYYDLAIKYDPLYLAPWNNKAVALTYLGRYREALNCYDHALAMEPENAIVWGNKADLLRRMHNRTDALACLNKSLAIAPKGAAAWNLKGVIQADMGRDAEALDCFNRSLGSDLYLVAAWNNKGVALAKMGNYDGALGCFTNAATINQNSTVVWLNGGLALKAAGQKEKSERAFATAREQGFNGTFTDYRMQSEPVLIEDAAKEAPGFEAAFATAGLCATGWLALRIKRRLLQ